MLSCYNNACPDILIKQRGRMHGANGSYLCPQMPYSTWVGEMLRCDLLNQYKVRSKVERWLDGASGGT